MKALLILVTVLLSLPVYAHDEDGSWFCDTQSSKMEGSVYVICGKAEGMNENEARQNALKAAYAEFKLLHPGYGKYALQTGRQDCSQMKDGTHQCTRLIRLKRVGDAIGPTNI